MYWEELPNKKNESLLGRLETRCESILAIAAGKGKNIVDISIDLDIFRKNQNDDLTLIDDLPGITRVALDDQAAGW
jgi:hypothetical protein